MHNLASRGNHLLSYTLTVMAIITGACALSSCFLNYARPASVASRRVELRSLPNYGTDRQVNDLAVMSFDVAIDLRDVFNWNVKQLFVYLTAEYSTENHKINQIVVWDRIIERGDDAVLDLQDVASKYYFWDEGRGLRNKNVTLFLSWNVIPVAGAILDITSSSSNHFTLPNVYKNAVRQ